jgi:hypothetical protein
MRPFGLQRNERHGGARHTVPLHRFTLSNGLERPHDNLNRPQLDPNHATA